MSVEFRFSGNFWSFIPISRRGKCPFCPPCRRPCLALMCCLTRQPPCFACPLLVQLPTFCLQCSLMQGQTSRSKGWNSKHFHNCIKVLSQFRTPYCTNLLQYSKRPKRCAWLCADTKLRIFASNLCARKLCTPTKLQPSVAIATCRKTCISHIVLLQYKEKPYLGFQNLRCHCKILGVSFWHPKTG